MRQILPRALILGALVSGCGQILGIDGTQLADEGSDANISPVDGNTSAIDAAPPDAALECDPPAAVCGSTCVDVASDPEHCGYCGHDCGGSACAAGMCQPTILADGLDRPVGLAVTPDRIFWSETERLASCPLPEGCVLAPLELDVGHTRMGSIGWLGDEILWVGAKPPNDEDHRAWVCPPSGCGMEQSAVGFTYSEFFDVEVGASRAYMLAAGSSLWSCGVTDCEGTVKQQGDAGDDVLTAALDLDTAEGTLYLLSSGKLYGCPEAEDCTLVEIGSIGAAEGFRIHGGRVYFHQPVVGPNATIDTCQLEPWGSCESFAGTKRGITSIVVDDDGVFWSNGTEGTIRMCPLSGCLGAPIRVADDQANPGELRLDGDFVYWLNRPATDGEGQVVRVRKP